jgi:RNA polymerase sigma-70 factor (ECF subfamily)
MTIREYNLCVDEFSDGIYRFLLKNIRNAELARDLVQESILKLWMKRKDVNFAKSKSYLFTTAYHSMIDQTRKKNWNDEEIDDHLNRTFEGDGNSYSDIKEILDLALEKLPAIQKSVVLLRDYEGYSYQEIGEITDLTEAQVKVYIYRARMSLKKYLVSIDMVI